MKKYFSVVLLGLPLFLAAQNIQLHYDFGKPENADARNFFVGTFEFYKPDTLGYTFMFADFEFDSPDSPRGVSLGYFEISRNFYMPWFRGNDHLRELGLHIEYNDGSLLYTLPDDDQTYGANINSAWLAGLEYPVKLGGFTLNTMLMYKYTRGSEAPDFQLTFAWFHMLFSGRVTLSGFFDIWSQDIITDDVVEKKAVIYSEPQIWYNLNKHLSLGSEFKISNNFVPFSNRPEIFPTIGVKWEF